MKIYKKKLHGYKQFIIDTEFQILNAKRAFRLCVFGPKTDLELKILYIQPPLVEYYRFIPVCNGLYLLGIFSTIIILFQPTCYFSPQTKVADNCCNPFNVFIRPHDGFIAMEYEFPYIANTKEK